MTREEEWMPGRGLATVLGVGRNNLYSTFRWMKVLDENNLPTDRFRALYPTLMMVDETGGLGGVPKSYTTYFKRDKVNLIRRILGDKLQELQIKNKAKHKPKKGVGNMDDCEIDLASIDNMLAREEVEARKEDGYCFTPGFNYKPNPNADGDNGLDVMEIIDSEGWMEGGSHA